MGAGVGGGGESRCTIQIRKASRLVGYYTVVAKVRQKYFIASEAVFYVYGATILYIRSYIVQNVLHLCDTRRTPTRFRRPIDGILLVSCTSRFDCRRVRHHGQSRGVLRGDKLSTYMHALEPWIKCLSSSLQPALVSGIRKERSMPGFNAKKMPSAGLGLVRAIQCTSWTF